MIKLCSSLEKVFHDRIPNGYEPKEITILKNERYSFQIAFDLDKKENIQIDTDLYVYMRKVEEVMCQRPVHFHSDNDYLFTEPQKAPDVLASMIPYRLNQWESVWIDLYSVDSGVYPVLIQMGDFKYQFIVKVIDEELPELDLRFTQWFHLDAIVDLLKADLFSDDFWELLEHSIHHYVKLKHNMILTPVITPPLDTAIGTERTCVQLVEIKQDSKGYHYNYEHLEQFIQICQKEGIKYFEISHLFSQWGAKCAPNIYINNELKFGWHTPSNDLEFLTFLKDFIIHLKDELKQLGIFENCYFHLSDEPDINAIQYKEARKAIEDVIEDCIMIEALRDYHYYEQGYVDIPVCSTKYLQPFLENRPEKLWCYYCCAENVDLPNHFISLPSYRNRVTGLLLYYFNMQGFLHWGYNFYNSEDSKSHIDPYETVDGNNSYPSGDPFIVYPSKNGIDIDSIRSMVLSDAISDYQALKLLESKIGRKDVISLIDRLFSDLSFTHYPKADQFYLDLRNQINQLIGEN